MEVIKNLSIAATFISVILLASAFTSFLLNLIKGLKNKNVIGTRKLKFAFLSILAMAVFIYFTVSSCVLWNRTAEPSPYNTFVYLNDDSPSCNMSSMTFNGIPYYPVYTDIIKNDVQINYPTEYQDSYYNKFISDGFLTAYLIVAIVLFIVSTVILIFSLVEGFSSDERSSLIRALIVTPIFLSSIFYGVVSTYSSCHPFKEHIKYYTYYNKDGIQYTDDHNKVIKEIVYRQDVIDAITEMNDKNKQ